MDLKQFGKENKIRKRADLAPLPKSASPVDEIDEEPEDDLTEDQLAELFGATEEPTLNASKQMIDLDDWVPAGLKPKVEPQIVEKAPLKPSNPIKEKVGTPTFRNRTDMLFSSVEFEADTTLGLRFQKRKIPATQLKEFAKSSEKVRLTDALKYTGKTTWFTFGVVSNYSEMRKSGGALIDITDLSSEPYVLRCVIFNSAFTGKIEIGSIVCISNPKKAKPYNGKDALAVNSADQVLIAGSSRDFSLCRGRKKDGGICKNVVNTHICRFCKFHAISEFKNQRVGQDLKAAATGSGLPSRKAPNPWNNKPVLKALTPAKKNIAQIKKDQERLSKLDSPSTSKPISSDYERLKNLSSPITSKVISSDEGRLKNISSPSTSKSIVNEKTFTSSPSTSKQNGQEKRKFEIIDDSLPKTSPTSHSAKKFCPPSTPPQRMSAAKRKALEYAKTNGGIVHQKAKKPVQVETPEPIEPKTPIHLSDKFLSMMKEKPRDADLFNDAETIERNKKFDRLEIVEEIGEKLAATHEVPVRAIRCLVCKKSYHQMPLQCVMNKHKCKVVAGTKRFFECNGCRTKTTTLEAFPVAECGKCGVWSWKKSGIAKNRVCTAAPQLSVRGFEETFVGSVVKDPNLNLLVPGNE